MSTYAKHFLNFISFVSTRILAIAAFIVSVRVFLHYSSEAQYGMVAIGFSFLGVSSTLDVCFGYVLTQSVARKLARSGICDHSMFSRIFWFYISSASAIALVGLISVISIPHLTLEDKLLYGWLPFMLPTMAVSGTVAAVFQAHNDLVYLNASRFLFEMGKAGSIVVSAVLTGTPVVIGPVLLAVLAIRAVLDLRILKSRFGCTVQSPNRNTFKRYVSFLALGMPSLLTVVLTLCVTILDKLLIARWYSREDVAHYSLAFDINAKAYILVYALNAAMYGIMLRNYALRRSAKEQIRMGMLAVCALALMYYLPFAVFSPEVLGLWVDRETADASSDMARVIAIGCILYLFGSVFENALRAAGRPFIILVVYGIAVGTYFLSISISQTMGVISFAWAYVLQSTLYCLGLIVSHYSSKSFA